MPVFRNLMFVVAVACAVGLASDASAKGGVGVAPDGTKGHLHVVERGDTLWDITNTYLGTPWVWPSLWKENQILDPHKIYPGDIIWITELGMKKLTAEEAADYRNRVRDPLPPAAHNDPEPAFDDPFASLDGDTLDTESALYFPGLHRYSFMNAQEIEGSGAVLGSHDESYWASDERRTIVSIGEGQTHVGDPFSVFRVRRAVHHPDTGKVVGYFVEMLGKLEVTEVHPEASYVKVESSYGEIEPGDRVIQYVEPQDRFVSTHASSPVDGTIVAQQPYRQYSGNTDLLILDRGKKDGVDVGVQLEIVRKGKEVLDPLTTARVLVPDDIVGRMLVLKADEDSSLALVTKARTEVRAGDHFRSY